ncbi:11226_t:CDS:2 [Gigaspora rosea]|nr:11226_t:CDS:2 [Gigaspora rosea]
MTSQHRLILDLVSEAYIADKVDHSLDSYMWYSTGDADCSDQDDYDP